MSGRTGWRAFDAAGRWVLAFVMLGIATTGAACDRFAVHQRLFFSGNGLPQDAVVSIVAPRSDRAFIGLRDAGVVVIDHGRLSQRRLLKPDAATDAKLVKSRVKAMAVDEQNQLWVGTAGGLFVFGVDDLELRASYGAETGFKDNIIQSVAAGGGEVAVGTTLGLALKSGGFKFRREMDGLPADLVNALAMQRSATLIGTANGVAVTETGPCEAVGLAGQWVNAVAPTTPMVKGQGETLVAIVYQTLVSLSARLRAVAAERKDLKPGELEAVLLEIQRYLDLLEPGGPRARAFFAGTNQGTFLVDPTTRTAAMELEGWTQALAVDPGGNLFVGQRGMQIVPLIKADNLLKDIDLAAMVRHYATKILAGEGFATPTSLIDLGESGRGSAGGAGGAGSGVITALAAGLATEAVPTPAEFLKRLETAEISTIHIDGRGMIWIGTSCAGAFCFLPVVVNAEQPIHVLEAMNLARAMAWRARKAAAAEAAANAAASGTAPSAAGDDSDANEEEEFHFEYYRVAAAPPEIEADVKPLILESIARWDGDGRPGSGGKYQYWIGRWSQLTPDDREKFIAMLAQYGDAYHLRKYIPLFFYDSFITLPVGPGAKGPPRFGTPPPPAATGTEADAGSGSGAGDVDSDN